MLNYLRRDFASVRGAMKFLTNNKMPDWVIIIWYILLSPLGFVLLPFILLWKWLLIRDLKKNFGKDWPTEM